MSDSRCPVCFGPAGGCDDFEWVEVTGLGDAAPRFVPGRKRPCEHARCVDVDSVTGERVAQLCLDCDAQLSAGFAWPRA